MTCSVDLQGTFSYSVMVNDIILRMSELGLFNSDAEAGASEFGDTHCFCALFSITIFNLKFHVETCIV